MHIARYLCMVMLLCSSAFWYIIIYLRREYLKVDIHKFGVRYTTKLLVYLVGYVSHYIFFIQLMSWFLFPSDISLSIYLPCCLDVVIQWHHDFCFHLVPIGHHFNCLKFLSEFCWVLIKKMSTHKLSDYYGCYQLTFYGWQD